MELASLLGSMVSMASLLPLGLLLKRPLQREFRLRRSQMQPWETQILLGPWFAESVAQWLNPVWLGSTFHLVPPEPLLELFTDAPGRGLGRPCGHSCGFRPLDLSGV
jgi:hypothetical protein